MTELEERICEMERRLDAFEKILRRAFPTLARHHLGAVPKTGLPAATPTKPSPRIRIDAPVIANPSDAELAALEAVRAGRATIKPIEPLF